MDTQCPCSLIFSLDFRSFLQVLQLQALFFGDSGRKSRSKCLISLNFFTHDALTAGDGGGKVAESANLWGVVGSFQFQGPTELALDGKGRISVPTRHREALSALGQGQLTITKHPHGCLMIFPRPTWEVFRDKVAALPMSAAGWRRVFLGNALDVEMDASGRVLVAPELRKAAGLDKDVTLLGVGSHFELWDTQRYAAHEAEVMAQPMPESLQDFTF